LIGNPELPCMHADPGFRDLAPGEQATINGEIIFFEGTVDQFEELLSREKRLGSFPEDRD
ncbi:hypothetical protein MYX78_13525, partial [Acidobacteria bacterium AH-259-G07]|nr:hypothetical protein [Acidobacteria bacterium AH-259-G07]